MPQLPSITYLIYQSIIEFASLPLPCFLPDFDSHSLCRYPPLCCSERHLSPRFSSPVLSIPPRPRYRSLACFLFSSQLPKNANKPLPLITAFIIFPYYPSTPHPPRLAMMYVLCGEHFPLKRLTVSFKEAERESAEGHRKIYMRRDYVPFLMSIIHLSKALKKKNQGV